MLSCFCKILSHENLHHPCYQQGWGQLPGLGRVLNIRVRELENEYHFGQDEYPSSTHPSPVNSIISTHSNSNSRGFNSNCNSQLRPISRISTPTPEVSTPTPIPTPANLHNGNSNSELSNPNSISNPILVQLNYLYPITMRGNII